MPTKLPVLQVRRRTEMRRLRLVLEPSKPVTCPAGVPVAEPRGCLCRIERGVVPLEAQPSALDRYCTGDDSRRLFLDEPEGHKQCPTFAAAWAHEQAQKQAARKRDLLEV